MQNFSRLMNSLFGIFVFGATRWKSLSTKFMPSQLGYFRSSSPHQTKLGHVLGAPFCFLVSSVGPWSYVHYMGCPWNSFWVWWHLVVLYDGESIVETIGRIGKPSLWTLICANNLGAFDVWVCSERLVCSSINFFFARTLMRRLFFQLVTLGWI